MNPADDQRSSCIRRVTAHGNGPPVLLLHTWWGLNQPIKDLADRLAGDGFTVMAPTFSTEPS